jgi:hypothetical protein
MHVDKEYNIIMYASDNFFIHVTNMQICMDKYLLCMQVILVFMHGSMFAMYQNVQFFFFFLVYGQMFVFFYGKMFAM